MHTWKSHTNRRLTNYNIQIYLALKIKLSATKDRSDNFKITHIAQFRMLRYVGYGIPENPTCHTFEND